MYCTDKRHKALQYTITLVNNNTNADNPHTRHIPLNCHKEYIPIRDNYWQCTAQYWHANYFVQQELPSQMDWFCLYHSQQQILTTDSHWLRTVSLTGNGQTRMLKTDTFPPASVRFQYRFWFNKRLRRNVITASKYAWRHCLRKIRVNIYLKKSFKTLTSSTLLSTFVASETYGQYRKSLYHQRFFLIQSNSRTLGQLNEKPKKN